MEPSILHSEALPSWNVSFLHVKIPSNSCQVFEMGLAGLDGTKSCNMASVVVEYTAPLDVVSCPLGPR